MKPLSATMVAALRNAGDDWTLDLRTREGTLVALETRGLVEAELRHRQFTHGPSVGLYRFVRRTDAGRRYLENLDDLARVRA